MEGGEDTAGFSPSPWEGGSFDDLTTLRPATVMETTSATAPLVVTTSALTEATLSSEATEVTPQITAFVAPFHAPGAPIPVEQSAFLHHPGVGQQPDHVQDPQHASHVQGDDDLSAEEDEEDDEEEEEENGGHIMQHYPFEEDLSTPSVEELQSMRTSELPSAFDNHHWESRTFFETNDSKIVAGESGIIEWTVEAFNGSKENPRKELLIRSPTVRIGNHDWRIKLLPRGHLSTDRVSAYVECVSLSGQTRAEWAEEQLPLPTIGDSKLSKQQAVTAQISVLMYNPEEPSVHEFRKDAHQFQADSPDHGWARFSSASWYDIHRRNYMAKQPLLRNDRLALKAFIRIVDDPTGCLWAHDDMSKPQDSVSMTGLQHMPPFEDLAVGPVIALWLHLRPFRHILYRLGAHDLLAKPSPVTCNPLAMLQAVLYRMRTRTQEPQYSQCRAQIHNFCDYIYDTDKDSYDVVQTMDSLLHDIEKQLQILSLSKDDVASVAQSAIEELDRVTGSRKLQFSGTRKTKLSIVNRNSVQEVVNAAKEELECLGSPQLLTVELDRQVFDKEKRRWTKLLTKIRMDDEISVGGTMYTLYGFAAHAGYLQTGRYSSFFRPKGLGNLWYTYKSGRPECLTMAKAVANREGRPRAEAFEESFPQHVRPEGYGGYGSLLGEGESTAYVLLYLRSDVASKVVRTSSPEPWEVPGWIINDYKTPAPAESTTAFVDTLKPVGTFPATTVPGGNYSFGDSAMSRSTSSGAQDGDIEMNDTFSAPAGCGSNTSGENSIIQTGDDPVGSPLTHHVINYLSQPWYAGQMKNHNYHGTGHLIHLNGDEYVGGFAHGSREGEGRIVYANGDIYEGSWHEGKQDGKGTCTEKRTGNVYKGNFKEGLKSGEGTTFWKISDEQSRLCQICYETEANAAFYDCGHVVACAACGRRVEICPVCRRSVRDVLKLYYTA